MVGHMALTHVEGVQISSPQPNKRSREVVMKSLALTRHHRIRAARRKQRISDRVYRMPYYPSLGYYSKNKIHCSCWMCSSKEKFYGLAIRNIRKLDSLNFKEQEYYSCS